MARDLATPDQILEELADRVVAQIDRRAPTGFESALDELTDYHAFLLDLYAAKSKDGSPLNYAELREDGWQQPHQRWIRQYRRLFDRAAERIPDEHRFIVTLGYVPGRLLGSKWDDRLSPAVVAAILDMQPILMHAIEAWVTRRSGVEADIEGLAERTSLAGSDSRSLARAMNGLVGAWESHLTVASSSYGWRVGSEVDECKLWARYSSAWSFLRQHGGNTAYSLAVAVWNGDRISAGLFREALVRWPGSALIELQRDGLAQYPWLLMPHLITLPWQEIAARSEAAAPYFLDGPSPDSIFVELVDGLHRDLVIITASLMLNWALGEGPVGKLAASTARDLVGGIGSDPTEPSNNAFGFSDVVRGLLRLQLVGERFEDSSHGGWLDNLVRQMDDMREMAVVPGRVYSPTTMHDREQLLVGDLALLTAFAPDQLDSQVRSEVEAIADDPSLLPSNDKSLRSILFELERYERFVSENSDALTKALRALTPEGDLDARIDSVKAVLAELRKTIHDRRMQRLRDAPVDEDVLESLRTYVEAALLQSPANVPIFDEVPTFHADEGELSEFRLNGVNKAGFVRPAMEQESLNFAQVVARQVSEWAAQRAISNFARSAKDELWIYAPLGHPDFWRQLGELSKLVGERPVLVVSHQDSIQYLSWRKLKGDSPLSRLNVEFDRGERERERGRYVATIEGIEVFALNIDVGSTWLTSARHLRRIGYAEIEKKSLRLNYEIDKTEVTGSLVFQFRQFTEWAKTPSFEIHFVSETG